MYVTVKINEGEISVKISVDAELKKKNNNIDKIWVGLQTSSTWFEPGLSKNIRSNFICINMMKLLFCFILT